MKKINSFSKSFPKAKHVARKLRYEVVLYIDLICASCVCDNNADYSENIHPVSVIIEITLADGVLHRPLSCDPQTGTHPIYRPPVNQLKRIPFQFLARFCENRANRPASYLDRHWLSHLF